MTVKASYVISLIEELAPSNLAEDWDNTGWQVGDSQAEVSTVAVALDPSPGALAKAEQLGAELLITHHPLLFQPLKHLRLDLPTENLVARFLQAGVGVFSAHTNLDHAPQGTSAVLAQKLGLINTEILVPGRRQKLYKLVTFVPPSHVENVRRALAAVGAGWIGNYSHCTFQTAGTGTFLPRKGTSPYIGEAGKLEYVDELRLETIVSEERLGAAVSRLLSAHPYEKWLTMYILWLGRKLRSGARGGIAPELTLGEFAHRVKATLALAAVTVVGMRTRRSRKWLFVVAAVFLGSPPDPSEQMYLLPVT